MTAAVEAIDLRRTFTTRSGTFRRTRKDVKAVKGVSFEIAPGELFGLLGPNGAGKTTTIKMLITLLIPTSGSASVLGHDVVTDVREVRRRIGYVFGGDRGQLQVLVVSCEPGAEVTQAVLAQLGETRVGRVSHRDPSLEDAYVELVTR